jgi:hypothetical protein
MLSDLIFVFVNTNFMTPPIVNASNFPGIINELTNENARLQVSLDLVLISIIGTHSKYGIVSTHLI